MDSSQRRLSVLKKHLASKQDHEVEQESSERFLSLDQRSMEIKPHMISFKNERISRSKNSYVISDATQFGPTRNTLPLKRQELLKWNGWGYNDSKFVVKKDKDYVVSFLGDRYKIGGNLVLPHFASWVIETLGVDFRESNPPRPPPSPSDYPQPIIHGGFLEQVKGMNITHSQSGEDRLFRGHGHTLAEIFMLRSGIFPRIPDLVIWPENHSQVQSVVCMAEQFRVVIIPFGGGTSVSGALLCPGNEKRMIVSLDTSQMNQILWLDEKNLTARIEAGIIGQDLERELGTKGYTTGHEPDSYEFSSLGGWVATRASGMKKNVYGNIEDLVLQLKVATPRGTVERFPAGPRISAGPDIHHFIMGSEGTLGVITEVTLKVRPVPRVRRYGSLVFQDFKKGVACMREVALHRCQPASIRLMDNDQFRFGHALKPPSGLIGLLTDGVKKLYLTKLKGFDIMKMCVATLLFEGNEAEVSLQEKRINEISQRHGGIPAGEANGERGYMLTFVIAYIRDLGFDYRVVAESFETSVPWDKVENLCHNVKYRVRKECDAKGIKHSFVTCRVTQTYDAGACVYFYFAFNYEGIEDPVAVYEDIEDSARSEIIGCGGNISHHHGVGKVRRKWMEKTMSSPALGALRALKEYFDPSDIFANGNLI